MTEPPFDIDRIRDDLNQRKARQAPRVITPGRKKQAPWYKFWVIGVITGTIVSNAIWLVATLW